VVIGVHYQNNIDRLGEISGVGKRLHRNEIGQMLALRPLGEIAHHVGLDIGGEDFSVGHAFGDPYAEISGARADIGDPRRALQTKRIQNLLRLLPGVAFGVVELLRPLLGIVEAAMKSPVC